MDFVILIACRSYSATIRDTLASIAEAKMPPELKKVIVIENGEEKTLGPVILQFRKNLPIEYLYTDKRGKSIALNIAIKNYIPDDFFILFTDDDVRVNPDWMKNYTRAFIKHGKGHYFGAAIEVDYEEEPDPDLKPLLPASARGLPDSMFQLNSNMIFLGCNWAAHKTDLVQAGLFSPKYGPGSRTGAVGQETYMQRQLRETGIKRVFISNNVVWHKVPADKCSWDWLKVRTEKLGKASYLSANKFRWLLRKTQEIFISTVKSATGSRENRYRLILQLRQVHAFIKAAFSNIQ